MPKKAAAKKASAVKKTTATKKKRAPAKKAGGKARGPKRVVIPRAKREAELNQFRSLARPGAMGMVLPKRTETKLREVEYDFKQLKPAQLRTIHRRLNESLQFCSKAAPYLAALHS